MLNNQRGITLVALVVTIVVLIILATISITVAINGGIIEQAQKTEQHQANADAQWAQTENNILDFIKSYVTE